MNGPLDIPFNEQQLGVPSLDIRIESIFGNFPMVTTTPTWVPKKHQEGLALDSTRGKLYYYDFTNNVWKTTQNARRVVSITSASSYTFDTDTYDALSITALAGTINTISASGTPSNFDSRIIRILDNGTARSVLWDATKYVAKGIALPSTTIISKCLTIGFLYDSVLGKWGCVAVAQE